MKAKNLIPVLTTAVKNRFSTLVCGMPGVGKTSIGEQIAKDLGYDFLVSQPSISENIDYKGLPGIIDGEAQFLPYGDLRRMINTDKKLLVLLDDIGQAAVQTQAALMHLILAREINGQKISDNVSFIACTNRRQDASGVSGLIKSLVSRFHMVLELETDVESWKQWALNNMVPIELIAFLNFRPALISTFDAKDKNIVNFACPRTITNLGKLIQSGIKDLECWTGCVGDKFSIEFAAFYKVFHTLANLPERVIMDPDNTEVPKDVSTLYALVGALSYKTTQKNITNILKYMERAPQEFQLFYVSDARSKDPNLMETNAMIEFFIRHPNLVK